MTDQYQSLVNRFCNIDSDESVQSTSSQALVSAVSRGLLTLPQVVALLAEPLTSMDDLARSRGTELLAVCVEGSSESLSAPHAALLLDFFVARVDDYNGIEGVVRGLVALFRRNSISGSHDNAAACGVARAVFNNVRVQALQQRARFDFLQLFALLLDDSAVRDELGGEFVHGFVQAVDGEKDPRNLLLVFELMHRIMASSTPVRDWKRYAEDLFEVMTCYFPITFRHQPGDPDAVTQDQLVVALRRCLAHSSLASFVVPFLLEKIDDGVPGTQRECVVTLVDCLRRAQADGGDATAIAARGEPPATDEAGQVLVEGVTELHAAAIGSAIMAQIVAGADTALVDCCVDSIALACAALTRGLQLDVQPQSLLANVLAQIVPPAAANVERDSTLPRLRLDSGRAVAACCRGCEASCLLALKEVLKPLLARVHSAVPTVRRADVALAAAMVAAVSDRLHSAGDARTHPLLPYRDALVDLFRSTLLHDPTAAARAAAVAGLGALAAAGSPALLDDEARAAAVRLVAERLLDDISGDVRRAALSALCDTLGRGEASVAHAAVLAHVLAETVPALLARVPEALNNELAAGAAADSALTERADRSVRSLAALAELAQAHALAFEAIVGPLTALACRCLVALTREVDVAADEQAAAVLLAHLFQCLNLACGRATPRSAAALHGEQAIAMPLIAALHERARATPHRLNVATMTQVIATVTGRVNVLDAAGQARVRDAVLAGDVGRALRTDGSPAEQQVLQLVSSIVRATARTCGVPRDAAALVETALAAVRHATCAGDVQLALTYVLAMLVNAVDGLEPPRELCALAAAGNAAAAVALVWAVKAAMARGAESAKALLVDTLVLELLCGAGASAELERMRDVVAAAFGSVLFADGAHVLHVEKRFYKQKYFSIVLPSVLAEYRKRGGAGDACGDRLLMALCGALRHMPAPVVALHADTLAPLVGAAVRRASSASSLAALEAVRALLSTPDSALTRSAADVQSLALALLGIACRTGAPAQQCAALATLRELSNAVPYRSIFPVKQKLIDSLQAVLGDDKRAVRHEAARTRNHFFTLVGAPAAAPAKHGCG